MALANCVECGNLFNKINRDICISCLQKENQALEVVKTYLRTHRGSTPNHVHERTGIEIRVLLKFIREGRLIAEDYPNMAFPCDQCGTPIQRGRFCFSCQNELEAELSQAGESNVNSDSNNGDVYLRKH